MQVNSVNIVGLLAVASALAIVGCNKKSETPDAAEKAGVALDKATEKTVSVAKTVVEKTATGATNAMATVKDATEKAIQKTGELIEKAGESVEKTGEGMQK